MAMQVEDDASSPEVMLAFYRRLYPFKSVFNWLNHQHVPTRLFTNREFAFTLPGDVYIRYNSFSSADELKRQICKLNPSRFEIGAVYNAKPRDKKTLRAGALQPVQRELVFDIDMTDYDSIRTCCSGKGICRLCWGFISAAIQVLDHALRDQFGFTYILWVYSGRRGVHCWVSDDAAMRLTDEQRRAVMGWLEVIKGGKDMTKKVNVRLAGRTTLHPAIQAASSILRGKFTQLILEDQDCFANEEQWTTLLDLIPEKSVVTRLRQKWNSHPKRSSVDKWNDIKQEVLREKEKNGDRDQDKIKESPNSVSARILTALEDVILQWTYPRLDAEVSKHRNHLLKAPFCVHPATGRVCVPVDPAHADKFDPERVPTVGGLLRELNEAGAGVKDEEKAEDSEPAGSHRPDWEKTSLKPYIEMLDKHVLGLMNETRRVKREAGDVSMEF